MSTSVLRKAVISILLILVLTVAGVLSVVVGRAIRKQPTQEEAPPQAIAVKTTAVGRRDVTEWLRGYGVAEPMRRANVSAQVRSIVEDVPESWRVGARVSRNDVLLTMDQREYRPKVEQAQARIAEVREQIERNRVEADETKEMQAIAQKDIEVAEAELARTESLLKEGAVSESARDQARSNLQGTQQRLAEFRRQLAILGALQNQLKASLSQAESNLEIERANLEYTSPRAPFDGYIEGRLVDQGDLVQPGQAMFVIVDRSTLELAIEIPASRAQALRPGAKAFLTTEENPPRHVEAVVDRIAPGIDPRNRTVSAYLVFNADGEEANLPPGVFLSATVEGRLFEDVYAIPRPAIVDGSIFVVEDGRAKKLDPSFFVMLEDIALTRDDLGGDIDLITSGFEELYDGAPVTQPASAPVEPVPAMPASEVAN